MSFDSIRSLALDVTFDVMGVPAILTRPAPDNTPLATTGIWITERDETQPYGTDFQKLGPRKVIALARTDILPNVPRGTIIAAAELAGGTVKNWRVDGYAVPVEADLMRLLVIETSETN